MPSDNEIIEKMKKAISDLERETGNVPDTKLLANKLVISRKRLRSIIASYLLINDCEGTSAFKSTLRELLLKNWNRSERLAERLVQLIDEHGVNMGIMPTKQAHQLSKERSLELLLTQPDANPPIAQLMDNGKYKFNLAKRERATKRKHHIIDVKEIRMRYEIAERDYKVKLSSASKILGHGNKVKVLTTLRGREIEHKELALALMEKFADELTLVSSVESEPQLDGKSVVMILSPAR